MSGSGKRLRSAERFPQARYVPPSGALPAMGIEAEFATVVDGEPRTPEDVFGSPRNFIRGPLIHRTGRSYHLPTGGAIYFDTGVMEVATPMIEIAKGCGARGTRVLWENLGFLRAELDAWEERTGRRVRLVGFSTHYNVSFDMRPRGPSDDRSVERLAWLLTHILPAPVMLLAANRRSTGIGVRPRGNRIEITADFTPDASLMAATATLVVAIARSVMRWQSYRTGPLDELGIPVVQGFEPEPHSSRKGWVAKHTSFPANPFMANVDQRRWRTRGGEQLSLREMAARITRFFWSDIRSLADPLSLQLIGAVMRGRAPSLLELDDRPRAYEDVGRLCRWDDLFPVTVVSRSRYERVVGHAVSGRRVRIEGAWHRPVGMKGWTHVVFRRESDGQRRVLSVDELLTHLGSWDRGVDRRARERRTAYVPRLGDRRVADRREDLVLDELADSTLRAADEGADAADIPKAPEATELDQPGPAPAPLADRRPSGDAPPRTTAAPPEPRPDAGR